MFGATVLLEGQKHPHERTALNNCAAILRGIEYAMRFQRRRFILIFYPLFLEHITPTILRDGRKLLMVRGLGNHASMSVKSVLESQFAFFYPTIVMSSSLTAARATLLSLTKLGVEQELWASVHLQVCLVLFLPLIIFSTCI